jgi:hypothetical protein
MVRPSVGIRSGFAAGVGLLFLLAAMAIVLLQLNSCSVMAPKNALLEQARAEYAVVKRSESVNLLAGDELREAAESLEAADKAWRRDGNRAAVDSMALKTSERIGLCRVAVSKRIAELRMIGKEDLPRK